MNTLLQDLRFGLRMLIRNPGFTAVALLSLALGIGANTAIFSLVNAVLLSSLPVPNPHELRVLKWSGADAKTGMITGSGWDDGPGRMGLDSVSYPVFRALREQCASQADLFGYSTLQRAAVRARHEVFTAEGLMVSDNFFYGLRVQPLMGRLIGPEDEQTGAVPAIVITYPWWERQFDLDPAVVGQSVTLNGQSFTVVGVLPRGFPGIRPGAKTEFYVSMSAQPQLMPDWSRTAPDRWWVPLMARLKPGVSDRQFQAALDVAFARETETIMKQPKVRVMDGRAGPAGERDSLRKPLLLLLGIVGVVLLVACTNVAGLSLARGAARQHELAVRAAIGAGRWRLMRQSLTESVLLGLLGGGLGILLAHWGRDVVSRLLAGAPQGLHYDTQLDLTVLGFTLGIVFAAALLSGLLPALRAARVNPVSGLKAEAALRAPRMRVGKLLVGGQVALSLLLLTGAGLYVRTLVNLVRINTGFATENLLLFNLDIGNAGYQGTRVTAFYDRVQQSLTAVPGVRSVSLTQFPLLAGWMSGSSFTVPGHSSEAKSNPFDHTLIVSETFFATMGIPVPLGRGLRASDTEGAPRVVVVNETFARTYFTGEDPLGQTLKTEGSDWQIIGVCRDAKYNDIKAKAPSTVYFSFRQREIGSAFVTLRTTLPPMAVVPAARRVVAAIDPNVPLSEIATQEQVRDRQMAKERTFATLCVALAALAVLLSCIGLYGLTAYNVARRTGEIGIRMALGATRQNIAGPVLREALLLAVYGMAVGVPAALALTQLTKSQLYGVQPNDPLTLIGAGGLLIAVALLAAWIPARRAARVDPMAALRNE